MTDDTDEDLPVLVTTSEAAVLAKVEPPTVRVWKHRGKLRAVGRNADGETLFALADVFRQQPRRTAGTRDT